MKILIVDDKKENLYMLETLLKGNGYEVVSAVNGAEALEKARRAPPYMIITDILMPVMDGFALCREWKWDDRLKEIPFVFYSATYTDSKDEELALSLGADRFIVKPMEPDKLIKIIHGVIRDMEKGKIKPKKPLPEKEEEVCKLYSECLEKKLEKKMVELEKEITERKLAEKERRKMCVQLQQAQKMEAIGTLAGGIAHDFNNVLTAVIGYTEMALDDVTKGPLLQNDLQEVLKAGIRAKDLVNQILTFSRQTEQELMPVKLKLVAKEAIKLLRASLPTTIEIRQDIQNESWVLADPTQIHQILMNLCTNAGHAMQEKGGILEVSLRNVDLKTDQNRSKIEIPKSMAQSAPGWAGQAEIGLAPGSYLRLTVSDTGHGMDRSTIQRIFDPYFTTKDKGEGTGLGLSVVHGIVKDHGGTVTVYSEPGRGAAFHVYLPVIERESELDVAAEKILPTGTERILFIDDEPSLVNLGTQMLEGLGYKVVTRTSSLEALELFKEQYDKFDLVFTDMTMPNMTGEELAKEVLKVRPDIPVILCTGFSSRITEEKAKAFGIRAFVMKPLLKLDMAKTIRRVLDE